MQNTFANYELIQGIVHITIVNPMVITLHIAKTIVADRLKFQNEKPFPIVFFIQNVTGIEKEAHHFLIYSGYHHVKAVAFIANQPQINFLTKIHLQTDFQHQNHAVFHNIQQALTFLNSF